MKKHTLIAGALLALAFISNGQVLVMPTITAGSVQQATEKFSPGASLSVGGWLNKNIALAGKVGVYKVAVTQGANIPIAFSIIGSSKNHNKTVPIIELDYGANIYNRKYGSSTLSGKDYFNIAGGVKFASPQKGSISLLASYSMFGYSGQVDNIYFTDNNTYIKLINLSVSIIF